MMKPKIFDLRELQKELTVFKTPHTIVEFIEHRIQNVDIEGWMTLNQNVKGIVLRTSAYRQRVFEVHEEFYDLHLSLEGEDKMHWAKNTRETGDYEPDGDYRFLNGDDAGTDVLTAQKAVLIPPGVPHLNELKENSIKAVFKIHKSLCQK